MNHDIIIMNGWRMMKPPSPTITSHFGCRSSPAANHFPGRPILSTGGEEKQASTGESCIQNNMSASAKVGEMNLLRRSPAAQGGGSGATTKASNGCCCKCCGSCTRRY